MLPVAATLVRVVVGIMFLVHVWGKFNAGPARIAAASAIITACRCRPVCLCGNGYGDDRRRLPDHRAVHALLGRGTRSRNRYRADRCTLAEGIVRRSGRLRGCAFAGHRHCSPSHCAAADPIRSITEDRQKMLRNSGNGARGASSRALCVSSPCCHALRLRRKAQLKSAPTSVSMPQPSA